MEVTIGTDGKVLDDVVTPGGSSGSPEIDRIGLDFLKRNWRWRPRDAGCGPVKTQVKLDFGG